VVPEQKDHVGDGLTKGTVRSGEGGIPDEGERVEEEVQFKKAEAKGTIEPADVGKTEGSSSKERNLRGQRIIRWGGGRRESDIFV